MGVVKLSTAGILDYQKYSSALAGNSPYIPFSSDFDLLETEILTGSQASVTFSSLNSTYGADYQHLQIRGAVLSDRSAAGDDLELQFNSDTGSNYSTHTLIGYGVVASFASANSSVIYINGGAGGATVTNKAAGLVLDILDPFETTKYTTARALAGADDLVGLSSGAWRNTAALTDITISVRYGTNLAAKTRLSLYGLRGV